MNIHIEVIPREKMRPEVDGADWFWDSAGNLQVKVCPMSDWRYEVLLGIHEAVEALMAKHNGVSQSSVDAFDQEYDRQHPNEPDLNAGDDPAAPYKLEHTFATAIERILCGVFRVDWKTYDDELATTYPGPSKRPEVRCFHCGKPITTPKYRIWGGSKRVCQACWKAIGGADSQPQGNTPGVDEEPPCQEC